MMLSPKLKGLCPLLLLLLVRVADETNGSRFRLDSESAFRFRSKSVRSIHPTVLPGIHPACVNNLQRIFLNGSCNNVHFPKQGASNTPFRLLFKPSDRDPRSKDYPSPRLVSNLICNEPKTILNSRGITELLTFFGQLVDHTFAETHTAKETLDVAIPADDKIFPAGGVMPFTRTSKMKTDKGFVSPENVLSSYVDASSVYGVTEALARRLRTLEGGKMILDDEGLLPQTEDNQFLAGDSRASENPALQAMHTLFVREHNRVCDELKPLFPSWDDETMYRAVRRIVSAEFQSITFYEFLPTILGRKLPAYDVYKPFVNGAISNEFATAFYRLGHTLIKSKFNMFRRDGTAYTVQLRDTFFKTDIVRADGIDGVLRGILNNKAAEVDVKVTSEVRNALTLGTPARFDLVSLNIQRGRDHAIPSYNDLRRYYNLGPYRYFSQITKNRYLVKSLQQVYGGDIEKIDAWVGGLAEDHDGYGSLGPLFAKAWMEEFLRMRDGNRHHFENPGYFPPEIMEQSLTVKKLFHERDNGGTMRRIVVQNTQLPDKHVPHDVFRIAY